MKKILSLFAVIGVTFAIGSAYGFQVGQQQGGVLDNPTARWENSQKKGKTDNTIRPIKGMVLTEDGKPVSGAVVKLKDTKTLQVRSFITQQDGRYHFYGLSVDKDYQITAQFRGMKSKTRTLSVFNSNRNPVMDLELTSGTKGDSEEEEPPAPPSGTPSKSGSKPAK